MLAAFYNIELFKEQNKHHKETEQEYFARMARNLRIEKQAAKRKARNEKLKASFAKFMSLMDKPNHSTLYDAHS